ncbi:Equilibrative Nucleoside Transporter [Phytophthora megakarya]|uniref:Equilibrative Nucleoside Transporter n=1 Tax=Phytophthora megakarya TaxID=4795 RepID=A0A225UT66_9STRA|nr:Equilibrative Nucleoside Transporter [Phytophthora megakarya]
MSTLNLIVVFFAATGFLASITQAGFVDLFKDTKYKTKLSRIDDIEVGYCYSFACEKLDNAISSARWGGLPEKSSNGDDVMISFFVDRDCREHDIWWRTRTQSDDNLDFPSNFKLDGLEKDISAFMVWRNKATRKKAIGSWLICNTESGTMGVENGTATDAIGSASGSQTNYTIGL